jgi:hypothetical protein
MAVAPETAVRASRCMRARQCVVLSFVLHYFLDEIWKSSLLLLPPYFYPGFGERKRRELKLSPRLQSLWKTHPAHFLLKLVKIKYSMIGLLLSKGVANYQ